MTFEKRLVNIKYVLNSCVFFFLKDELRGSFSNHEANLMTPSISEASNHTRVLGLRLVHYPFFSFSVFF
jgi:hypothetical protein